WSSDVCSSDLSIAATSRNQLILNAGKNAADTGVTDQPTGQWRTVFANLSHLGQRIGCLDQVVVSIDKLLDVGGNTLLILGNRNRNALVLVGRDQTQCHIGNSTFDLIGCAFQGQTINGEFSVLCLLQPPAFFSGSFVCSIDGKGFQAAAGSDRNVLALSRIAGRHHQPSLARTGVGQQVGANTGILEGS